MTGERANTERPEEPREAVGIDELRAEIRALKTAIARTYMAESELPGPREFMQDTKVIAEAVAWWQENNGG